MMQIVVHLVSHPVYQDQVFVVFVWKLLSRLNQPGDLAVLIS